MTMTMEALQVSSHEAAHVSAALLVGRRVLSVTRGGRDAPMHGLTDTEPHDRESVHEALVVLLAGPIVQPRGGDGDMKNAKYLASFTDDPEATLADATRHVVSLIQTAEFRRVKRVIEEALWSRPTLSGEDIDYLVNEGRDRWIPSV